MGSWLYSKDLPAKDLPDIIRPFFNAWFWSRSKLDGHRFIFPPFFKFLQDAKFLANEDCLRLLKAILEKLASFKEPSLVKEWGEFLQKEKIKISGKDVCEWVRNKARKGTVEDRNVWEEFQKLFALPFWGISQTTPQTLPPKWVCI